MILTILPSTRSRGPALSRSNLRHEARFEGMHSRERIAALPGVRYVGYARAEMVCHEVGIVDTIGYQHYNNRDDIRRLMQARSTTSLLPGSVEQNQKAPVYLIDSKCQTDHITRLISRVKKARSCFRSFDPVEQPRMSAPDAVVQISQIRRRSSSFAVQCHRRRRCS
jgi:hypothetical protein